MIDETAPASPSAGSTRPGFARRAIQWLWVSDYADQLQKENLLSAPSYELLRRARLSLELTQTLAEPPQAFEHGSALAVTCDLYRQAVYWALRARAAGPEGLADSSPDMAPETPVDPAVVWARVDRALLSSLELDNNEPEVLEQALAVRSFADFAELPSERLSRMAEHLGSFARALTNGARRLSLERLWLRRFARAGVVAVALLFLTAGAQVLRAVHERSRDVARGKAWVTSSKYSNVGCVSPLQSCPETTGYFFHTEEQDNPWLEIDLAQVQHISGLIVENRVDCCQDRGLPLIVEVSRDHQHWTEVARRTTRFTQWKADFPAVEARWVKLRSPQRTMLHLNRVGVLR
jgi:hypothetical protein